MVVLKNMDMIIATMIIILVTLIMIEKLKMPCSRNTKRCFMMTYDDTGDDDDDDDDGDEHTDAADDDDNKEEDDGNHDDDDSTTGRKNSSTTHNMTMTAVKPTMIIIFTRGVANPHEKIVEGQSITSTDSWILWG